MNKTGGVGVIAAVLLLSGCASGPSAAPEAETTPSAAPITMDAAESTPEPSDSQYGEYTQDEFYVASITSAWRGETPDDASLIGAASLACEQMTAGADPTAVIAVQGEGEDAAWNNARLVQYAIQVYCPQFDS